MKETQYFTSKSHATLQLELAIDDAKRKKYAWIIENIDSIGKIESEDIKITTYGGNNTAVFVTIQLTYYPKE